MTPSLAFLLWLVGALIGALTCGLTFGKPSDAARLLCPLGAYAAVFCGMCCWTAAFKL